MTNHLYYGDNLQVIRDSIGDESVDLIYLDPPFNSQASYNILFRAPTGEQSKAQIEAFEDTWHWNDRAERAFDEVIQSGNTDGAEMLRAMRSFLKENDMMAYLTMMAVRLLELHRVLKPTGSLYLHCDPTASHYLKILLDSTFGAERFVSEVVWRRTNARGTTGKWPAIHDVICITPSPAISNSGRSRPRPTKPRCRTRSSPATTASNTRHSNSPRRALGRKGRAASRGGFDPNKYGRHWGERPGSDE